MRRPRRTQPAGGGGREDLRGPPSRRRRHPGGARGPLPGAPAPLRRPPLRRGPNRPPEEPGRPGPQAPAPGGPAQRGHVGPGGMTQTTSRPEEAPPRPTGELVSDRLDELLGRCDPKNSPPAAFWAAQFELGLAWVEFPPGRGGLGVDSGLQDVVDERLRQAGAPRNEPVNLIGVAMMAPTLAAFGTEEQQDRFLRPAFTGREIWCQLFSEPGAGSDLAAVATRAERSGDHWIVNGQKVWTTMAHRADFGLLLARSDRSVPKHAGLTYFVVDMHAPGVV